MYANFKDKAVEFVKIAVAEDEAGNYDKAYSNYLHALEYFKTHLKYEKNPRSKEAITAKFKEYLERAEYLRSVLDGRQENPSEAANGNAAAVQKARKNGGGGGGGGKDDDEKEKDKMKASLGSAILQEKPNVKWDDVAGLEGAKEALKEAVILPVKFPQFFTGKRKPWSGILLYGPPGTGKSYLAKAVATEADSTFFAVSSSDLVSKWLGESEKLVSQLFSLAREAAPSIVFIDEVDSLCSQRGDSESEAARRIKTQLMIEMQGVNTASADARVLVLAATNLPYSLDQAIRRRFDKRIYIPLPEAPARAYMFKVHLGDTPHQLTDQDFADLGAATEGFSGSDVNVLVKDVLMQPIRLLREATHFRTVPGADGKDSYSPCAPNAPGAFEATLQQFAEKGMADRVIPPKISRRDFDKVLLRARPTVSNSDLGIFQKFTTEFGEEG